MAILSDSTLAKYVRAIKSSPRELIFNRRLLVTAALYAMSGIPISTLPSRIWSTAFTWLMRLQHGIRARPRSSHLCPDSNTHSASRLAPTPPRSQTSSPSSI